MCSNWTLCIPTVISFFRHGFQWIKTYNVFNKSGRAKYRYTVYGPNIDPCGTPCNWLKISCHILFKLPANCLGLQTPLSIVTLVILKLYFYTNAFFINDIMDEF